MYHNVSFRSITAFRFALNLISKLNSLDKHLIAVEMRPWALMSCIGRPTIRRRSFIRYTHNTALQNDFCPQIYERLSNAFGVLNSGKSFKHSAYECQRMYEGQLACLLQDILTYPHINREMIDTLLLSYPKSKSIRAIVLQDLLKLLEKGQIDMIKQTILFMIEKNLSLPKYLNFNQSNAGSAIVEQAVMSGEPLLAASFALHLKFNGMATQIDKHVVELLLKAMTISSDGKAYNSYGIFKLLQEFDIDLSSQMKNNILVYLLQANAFFLPNLFMDRHIKDKDYEHIDRDTLLNFINYNLEFKNIDKAYQIWLKIQDYDFKNEKLLSHTIQHILESMRNDNRQNEVYEMIDQIMSKDISHITDFLILFLGKDPNLSKKVGKVIATIRPPLKRLTLTLLLEAFEHRDGNAEAEKILNHIFKSDDGINHRDFKVIIQKLLNDGNIPRALELFNNTNISISKTAGIEILKVILYSDSELKYSFSNVLATKFQKLDKEDNSRALLTLEIIRFISRKISNRAARSLYSQLNKLQDTELLNLGKYHLSNNLAYVLNFPMNSKIDCLFIILDQALINEDLETTTWCLENLKFEGLLLKDLLQRLSRHNSQFTRSILKSIQELY